MGQESMTYKLSRHSKNQSGDQWTEFSGTGINDLQAVKAFKKPKWWSEDRIPWDRNQWLTSCESILKPMQWSVNSIARYINQRLTPCRAMDLHALVVYHMVSPWYSVIPNSALCLHLCHRNTYLPQNLDTMTQFPSEAVWAQLALVRPSEQLPQSRAWGIAF